MLRFEVAALRSWLAVNGYAPFSAANGLAANGFTFDE